jgi:hypothetical protein
MVSFSCSIFVFFDLTSLYFVVCLCEVKLKKQEKRNVMSRETL